MELFRFFKLLKCVNPIRIEFYFWQYMLESPNSLSALMELWIYAEEGILKDF